MIIFIIFVNTVFCRLISISHNIIINYRICLEYKSFCNRALKVPDDSQEMIDLIAFMEKARNELVRDLWERVQDSLKRLSYLLDVHSFSGSEVEMNSKTLMWPTKLNPVFEKNEQVTCHSNNLIKDLAI